MNIQKILFWEWYRYKPIVLLLKSNTVRIQRIIRFVYPQIIQNAGIEKTAPLQYLNSSHNEMIKKADFVRLLLFCLGNQSE